MENISKNITYREATKSRKAIENRIENKPNEVQLANMKRLAKNVFEPLRKALGDKPIIIDSFFRSPLLNKTIKGAASRSQHMAMNGAAMDIDNESPSNREIFFYILDNLDFDQLIWEYGDNNEPDWVHVSYVSKKKNRRQVLKCRAQYPKYIAFKREDHE